MTEPTANRKHLILDAACRAIAATGAAAVRVSDVAREAGVSTALVHYYFPSRAEVIVEAFAHADDLADAVAEEHLAQLANGREPGQAGPHDHDLGHRASGPCTRCRSDCTRSRSASTTGSSPGTVSASR